MELKDAVKMVSACETFARNIKSDVPKADLRVLGEIKPEINEDLLFLENWIKGNVSLSDLETTPAATPVVTKKNKEPWLSIAPDADWRLVNDMNFMVSSYGDIWDLNTNSHMPQYFQDGDMRISLGDDPFKDTRRVAPIVSKAFQIWSPDRNADFIIGYKDGDRRNMRIDNIYWKKPTGEYVDTRKYLVEDICRRIIEFNGDVDKIITKYESSRPSVSRASISQIMEKKVYTEISDLFFIYRDGKIYPREDSMAIDTSTNTGMDVGQFFRVSGDRKITGELIRDKIKKGEALTLDEKVIVVFMAMDVIGLDKANDVKKISNVIKNTFGTNIGFEFINQVRNDYTSELAEMFRGEVPKSE